ncbi:MAG: hypothetical protein E7668_01310 [Ruminococcaceae bacterium]|nr:hypothetical protein [Oscillospiraceae bacterium]
MRSLKDCTVCRKLAKGFGALCEYSMGKDYDMTLSLYADDSTHSPECSCHLKGSGRQKLWRLLAIAGAVVLIVALLRRLCSWISD